MIIAATILLIWSFMTQLKEVKYQDRKLTEDIMPMIWLSVVKYVV